MADEIAMLRRSYGVDVVLLTDEYPTADPVRWEALLDRLIELDLGVDLLMETRVQDIVRDRAILWKYRRAGVVHVYVGIEATDQATLDLVNEEMGGRMMPEEMRRLFGMLPADPAVPSPAAG